MHAYKVTVHASHMRFLCMVRQRRPEGRGREGKEGREGKGREGKGREGEGRGGEGRGGEGRGGGGEGREGRGGEGRGRDGRRGGEGEGRGGGRGGEGREGNAFRRQFNEQAGLNAYPSRSGDFHELLSFMHNSSAISRLLPQLHKGHPSLHGLPCCLCIAALASGIAGRVCYSVQA